MPHYALLIYVPQGGPPADQRDIQPWIDFTNALDDAGARVTDAALELGDAKTVRVRGGETLVTDGHFDQTAEVLGGYYVIDVPDDETAHGWAARIPSAPSGSVEVRPLMTLPEVAA